MQVPPKKQPHHAMYSPEVARLDTSLKTICIAAIASISSAACTPFVINIIFTCRNHTGLAQYSLAVLSYGRAHHRIEVETNI